MLGLQSPPFERGRPRRSSSPEPGAAARALARGSSAHARARGSEALAAWGLVHVRRAVLRSSSLRLCARQLRRCACRHGAQAAEAAGTRSRPGSPRAGARTPRRRRPPGRARPGGRRGAATSRPARARAPESVSDLPSPQSSPGHAILLRNCCLSPCGRDFLCSPDEEGGESLTVDATGTVRPSGGAEPVKQLSWPRPDRLTLADWRPTGRLRQRRSVGAQGASPKGDPLWPSPRSALGE